MARVNFEERFYAEIVRLQRFADLMGWDLQQAHGCLGFLYHASQEAYRIDGTAEDIIFWSRTRKPEDQEKLIAALSDKHAHYISEIGIDPESNEMMYEISGNAEQIKSLKQYKKRAQKGARTRHQKAKKQKEPSNQSDESSQQADDKHASGLLDESQYKAIQGNTKQGKTRQCKAIQTRGALPELAAIWNEFSDSSFAKVTSVNSKSPRGKSCRERWEENPRREFWIEVVQRINASNFCRGGNDRGWLADFDFLIRPDSAARVLEGKYDDRKGVGASGNQPGLKIKSQEDIEFDRIVAEHQAMLLRARGYDETPL